MKFLCYSREPGMAQSYAERFLQPCQAVGLESITDSLANLQSGGFSGLFVCGDGSALAGLLLQSGGLLEQMRVGIAVVGPQREVLWHNSRLLAMAGRSVPLTSRMFYECFGEHEIVGPDFCPLNTAFCMSEPTKSTLRVGEKSFYEIDATPVFDCASTTPDIASFLIVMIRDISAEVLQRQKLTAIYQAGVELGNLTPQELLDMPVPDRIELLKSKILHFTRSLLEYETVEIRLLDRTTGRLNPLLAVGMNPEAERRELFAAPTGNGVTGYVAHFRQSYLCEDTTTDPHYLPGAPQASSSLTVPLRLHDEVLGTFNVESPRANAFNQNDLQFLEQFAVEISVALNTLELLAVEKFSTASESTNSMLREVAAPVDEIIQETTWLLENTIGSGREVTDRLRTILSRTREMRQAMEHVEETIRPKVAPGIARNEVRPALHGKRVLVVDSDSDVRGAAHELLRRFGCHVETASSGQGCFMLTRTYHYDAVITDIRLPDHNGWEVFSQLRDIDPLLPVILMTGYGYDAGHSIVKSRQAGLKSVLFKPFRVDQLVTELEKNLAAPAALA